MTKNVPAIRRSRRLSYVLELPSLIERRDSAVTRAEREQLTISVEALRERIRDWDDPRQTEILIRLAALH